MSKERSDRRLVYSSERGRMCARCGHPADACRCATESVPAASSGPVRIRHETKGRKGKGVTLVTGVPLPASELAGLCGALKRACGSGGTVKQGTIEIQGEHMQRLAELLSSRGFQVQVRGS